MPDSSAKRRPRVGVDFHTYDGIYQGSRSHLLGLYREAVTMAPDIDFVLLLAKTEQLRDEVPEFRAANVHLQRMSPQPSIIRLAVQLGWHQWRQQLDLLHVQYRLPFVPLGRCACTIHDVLFETHPQFFEDGFVRMARLTSRTAVRRSQPLFTVSDYSRFEVAHAYGVPAERIVVTYNGVDTNRFFPGSAGVDIPGRYGLIPGKYLCTLGRLEPRKNHITLVRAHAQLASPRPALAIIGQRDFSFSEVFSEVQRLGTTDDVLFLEDVSDTHLPALLRHARLFVYPTFAEGFGMPVVEAMASGVPVITSSTTSLPEVAGGAARLVVPDDVSALAQALREDIDALPAELCERVSRGLNQVKRFNWRSSAEVMLKSFRAQLLPCATLTLPVMDKMNKS